MNNFMISKSFVVGLVLAVGLIFQSSQAMDGEKHSFEKGTFQFTLSPHHQDNIGDLTLEHLITEAQKRKGEFDSLFGYVCQHGLHSKKVNTIFDKELTLFEEKTGLPSRNLILLNRLKTDYTIEKNLLDFYIQSLSQLHQTKEPSKEAIEKLYQETVYIVRNSTHSFISETRNFLASSSGGECFWEGDNFGVPYEFQPAEDESQLYYHLALAYRLVNIDEESPEVISQMLNLLAKNSHKVHDPLVIFNYNSLVFYLKLERFLNMQYDHLVFDPTFYHFDSDISNQSQQFLLSALYKEKTEHWMGQIFDQASRDRNRAIITRYLKNNTLFTQSIQAEIPTNKLVSIFFEKTFPPQLKKPLLTKRKQAHAQQNNTKSIKRKKGRQARKEHVDHTSQGLNQGPTEQKISKEPPLIDKIDDECPKEILVEASIEKPIKRLTGTSHVSKKALLTDKTEEKSLVDVKLIESPTEQSIEDRNPFKTRNNWNLCGTKGIYNPNFSNCNAYCNKFTGGYNLQDQNLQENWNINNVQYHVSSRTSPNYSFQGQTFFETDTYFNRARDTINVNLLQDIKVYTGRTSDKLPNLGTGFITLHYMNAKDVQCSRTFDLESLYLSGNQFFHGEQGNQFKHNHAILNANQDFLEDEEKINIYQKDSEIRGMYINLSLENKIRKEIIGGPYKYNAMDSESLFMLDLVRKLPHFLSTLIEENTSTSIHINGLFLGISSYRDCCGGCISVIHGFQHASKDILSRIIKTYFENDGIHIHPDYGTLAVTYGEIRVAKGKGAEEPRKVLDTLSWLKRNEHHLARIRY